MCDQQQLYRLVLHNKDILDPKRSKRSTPDSIAPTSREACHRHLVAAMVQEIALVALASEKAKRTAPQVSEVLSVDELASQLVSIPRAQLTTTLAKALIAERVGPPEA